MVRAVWIACRHVARSWAASAVWQAVFACATASEPCWVSGVVAVVKSDRAAVKAVCSAVHADVSWSAEAARRLGSVPASTRAHSREAAG